MNVEPVDPAMRAELAEYMRRLVDPPGTVRVRVARELFESLLTRDRYGNRLRVDWGAPDRDGFHEPTIVVDRDDNLLRDALARLVTDPVWRTLTERQRGTIVGALRLEVGP